MCNPGSGIYGHRLYNGAESLQLNFLTALSASITVDIYGSVTSMCIMMNDFG